MYYFLILIVTGCSQNQPEYCGIILKEQILKENPDANILKLDRIE